MTDEGFFRRWARLKSQGGDGDGQATADLASVHRTPVHQAPRRDALAGLPPFAEATAQPAPSPAPVAQDAAARAQGESPRALPTLDDAARLHADSDFSAFVSQGVDKAVQRLAMKKLFADPHFNLMDGLDVYIDDYNKPDPISASMLAALKHAKSLFPPPAAEEPTPGNAGETGPGQRVAQADPPSPQSPQDYT